MVTKPLPGDPQTAAAPAPRPNDAPRDGWDDPLNDNTWEDVGPRADAVDAHVSRRHDVPAALRPGQGPLSAAADDDDGNVWDEARSQQPSDADRLAQVPDALKPGGGANRLETNPFLKRKPVPQTQDEPSGSSPTPPTDSFARLDLDSGDQASNPWHATAESHSQKASSGRQTPQRQPVLLDDDNDPWTASEPPPPQPPAKQSPALLSLPSDEGSAWNDDVRPEKAKIVIEPPTPAPAAAMSNDLLEEPNVWDDLGSLDKGKSKAAAASPNQQAQLDDWNLIDVDSSSDQPKQPEQIEDTADTGEKPPLPPRDSERPRWVPSREPVDGKSETYQVKNIRWHDDTSAKNPRTSPILIQNKNGPCPLVALVNALTLTTPADIPDTALVQVLRSREQISLNLLLDAVFDELMSPRRTSSEDALPDVGDLYGFLQSLHTGMNVNPRFIPTPEMVTAYKRTSLTHLHPTERGELIPGTFENTAEMSLYATFSIPLIHGWLAARSEPVYEALERQAASYEEVQNLLFREEELEDKLSNSEAGLTEAEQQLYQDIVTIKIFLHESATQLTPWGIEVIGKAMRPGTFAILFRNDHFSTLYCHPHTMQLLSLVTDAGYGSHDEVVWESLVDVNGEQTEYLSGDFRVVGGGGTVAGSSSGATADHGGEWTTVQGRRGKAPQHEDEAPMSPQHEQEDRDLALALQLQEEEDQRHREEQARRRRESILSEQYIEQQGQRPGPVSRGHRRTQSGAGTGIAPERRSSNSVNVPVLSASHSQPRLSVNTTPAVAQQVRPLVPPRRQAVSRAGDAEGDDAPPSYEQAAHDRAFVPPAGHPSHAGSSPVASRQTSRTSSTGQAPQQQQQQQQQRPMGMGSPATGRRVPVSSGPPPAVHQGRDRDCVVM